MNLSHFLTLTDVIVLDILNDWLKVADVAHLDSAYCSERARPQFLSLLSAFRVLGDKMKMKHLKEYLFIIWAMNRSIKVHGFTLSSQLLADDKLLGSLLELNGPSIRWIAFGDCDHTEKLDSIIAKVTKDCTNTGTLFLEIFFLSASLSDACYPQLTQAFHRLHTLHIKYSKVSSNGLANMLQHSTMLKRLHTGYLTSPLPAEVALPSLEQFSALRCNVPEAVLFAIAANCPRMKHMDMFTNSPKASNEAVQAILQGCPLLQYTDVEYATGLSHELRVELARRRNFTELNFGIRSWSFATFELFERVLCVSPNLLELTVHGLDWLTDDALAVCAQHCRKLESLHLGFCYGVSVAGILAITEPGNKLNTIKTPGCRGLGDEAVLAVAQRCPHLKVFRSPPQVSSEAIVALAKGCPLLEEVHLDYTQADDAALALLCLHCPQLRTLFVEGCPGVTQLAVEALGQQYPKLTINM